MIGSLVARRAAPLVGRVAAVQRTQARNLRLDQPTAPNKIIEQQRELQKGATPYLRGEADPTYLRKGQNDNIIFLAMMGGVAIAWLHVGWSHIRLWGDKK